MAGNRKRISDGWLRGSGWFAVPRCVLDDDRLSSAGRLVMVALCRRSGVDGETWPAVRELAAMSALSAGAVSSALVHLQKLGYLEQAGQRPAEGKIGRAHV